MFARHNRFRPDAAAHRATARCTHPSRRRRGRAGSAHPHRPVRRHSRVRASAGRIAHGEIEQRHGRHQGHRPGRGGHAASSLLQVAQHTVGGGQAEGRPAGQHDRIDRDRGLVHRERVELPAGRGPAAHFARGDGVLRQRQHGTAGLRGRIRPVPDPDARNSDRHTHPPPLVIVPGDHRTTGGRAPVPRAPGRRASARSRRPAFGRTADRDESFAALDAFAVAGGSMIDTADEIGSHCRRVIRAHSRYRQATRTAATAIRAAP